MVSLCAVGDLMLGDSEKCIGYGTRSLIEKFGPDYPFAAINSLLKADIVFGNLEAVLSDYDLDRSDMFSSQMRAAPCSIEGIKKVFNVISIANNHMMQHGVKCFQETVGLLNENNIGVVGLKGDPDTGYFSKPYIKNISSITCGFLGYAFEHDVYNDYPLYAFGKEEQVLSDIHKLRLLVDIVIVSCHWGDEFIKRPKYSVIQLAQKMINAGSSLILGHHPHVVQPIEKFNSGIVAYSLGNFVTDMGWDSRLLEGCILKLKLNSFDKVEIDNIYLTNHVKPSQPCKKKVVSDMVLTQVLCNQNNYVIYESEYLEEVNFLIKKNRLSAYYYLFVNFYKMHLSIFLQIIKYRFVNVFR